MGAYLINFIVYTAAMIGVIYAAVFVYKKSTEGFGGNKGAQLLGVEEAMNISPRKTLYIVRAGAQRFLLAGDVDKTTLIAELDDANRPKTRRQPTEDLPDIIDFSQVYETRRSERESEGATVFHNMMNKMN